MAQLKLFFLGPSLVERGGQPVEIDTRKGIALLAYLALTGERSTRDLLAAFLWPELDDRRAKAALRRTLSATKSAVGEAALYITREALGLEIEVAWCDVMAFERAIETVEEHRHGAGGLCRDCLAQLETANALYRDDFMAGFSLRDSAPFDDWQLQQAEYLRRRLTTALALLVQTYEMQGAFDQAIEHARRWLQLDPLREEAHRLLMQLYAWSGQRSAALVQYRECVRILEEELGVPPLEETTALYRTIQENRLERPAAGQPPVVDEGPAAEPERPLATIPLVGREVELARLHQIYEEVGPDGRFLVLAGDAGIGKTRLAEAFLAGLPEVALLQARCYEGEGHIAYAPFVQAVRDALRRPEAMGRLASINPTWLGEVARLLPEVGELFPDLPGVPPLDWPGASARFVEGLSRVLETLLSGPAPGILWLDDVQWADSASLDLLAFLARRLRGRSYLLLVCWREGELATDHRLRRLLAETRRDGTGRLISLVRLSLEAVSILVTAVAGFDDMSLASALTNRLYRETEGLPFLIAAYLESIPETRDEEGRWGLPPTVRDLFYARLAQTGETERQLLQAASVIGRGFTYELLVETSGRSDEETLPALEKLVERRLLTEQDGDPAYDFQHHKLRQLVYEEMSLVRRRRLHRRVAQALQGRRGSASDVPEAQLAAPQNAAAIAGHYQAAGLDAQAAEFYRQAGDYARSLFAHGQALTHYRSALALGHPDTVTLHEACGDLQVRLGEYAAALTAYERAAAAAGPAELARLEHKLGQVHYRLGEWALAEGRFEQAEAYGPETTGPADRAWLYVDWSYTAYRAGDMERAVSLAERAQVQAGDSLAQAQVHNILGILTRAQGDTAIAVEHFSSSLSLAAGSHLSVQISALNNLALAENASGNSDRALELIEQALEQCLTYGDRHWEAALRNNLADVLHELGQEEDAMAQLKQAVTIYAEIGRETGEWRPEIWKLREW